MIHPISSDYATLKYKTLPHSSALIASLANRIAASLSPVISKINWMPFFSLKL
jgi:hypothetical protein